MEISLYGKERNYNCCSDFNITNSNSQLLKFVENPAAKISLNFPCERELETFDVSTTVQ